MRIAVGGIEHESTSFLSGATPLEAFFSYARGATIKELGARSGEANTIIDGLIKGVRENNAELVPLIWCFAGSGSQPTLQTHETLKGKLLDVLSSVLPVDGVLLSLHGSYSAQGLDDADGDILKDVRALVGPDCPIMAVHDLHSNIGQTMVDNANALFIEKTYPHTDMAERALEATQIMIRTIRGEIQPQMAWRSLPLFWAAPCMITAEEPIRSAIDQLLAMEKRPGVLSASLGVGYQWADVNCAGASTLVITDGDAAGAQEIADQLARWVWERREVWQCEPARAADALDEGERIGKYPIILADQADNPGGGSPSDTTSVMRLFIERGLEAAAVLYICDPETIQQAKAVGVGGTGSFRVGGKGHELSGPPVEMEAEVVAVTDGKFVYDGPMFAKLDGDHGDSVLLKAGGLYVAVITDPQQPVDLAFCRTLGLDCRKLRYITVKSTGHFRSGFEPIAGSIFNVDEPAPLTLDFSAMTFHRLGRKVYPMDKDAEPGF